MRKTVIDNFKIGETVSLISYNPPLQGRIIDMYELNPVMVSDETLKKKYPKGIPIFEIILEDENKLRSFVKDVVKKV